MSAISALFRSFLPRPRSSPPPPHHGAGPKVQILSDLHLEVCNQYTSFTFPVTAPFLVLAGDIGCLVDYDRYLAFLTALVPNYERIFLVLGNHEFYGLSYTDGLEKAQALVRESCLDDKVVLLHRMRWDDPSGSGLTVLGCTLWSNIPKKAYDVVMKGVNDFYKIIDWTPAWHSRMHKEEAAWLCKQVAQIRAEGVDNRTRSNDDDNDDSSSSSPARVILIATHHAPVVKGSSAPEYEGNPSTCAFSTNLLDAKNSRKKKWKGVSTWLFGHTHWSTSMVLQESGIRLVANQRGYVFPGTKETVVVQNDKKDTPRTEFDPGFAVAV